MQYTLLWKIGFDCHETDKH